MIVEHKIVLDAETIVEAIREYLDARDVLPEGRLPDVLWLVDHPEFSGPTPRVLNGANITWQTGTDETVTPEDQDKIKDLDKFIEPGLQA